MTLNPASAVAPRRSQVILSHRTTEKPIVDWAAAQVEAMGVHCWVAEDHPEPGFPLSDKVLDAIGDSVAMIVLLTESAYSSPYVQQEIGAALKVPIPVIALVDRSLNAGTMAMLQGIEYIEFDSQDLGSSSASLIAGLRNLAERSGAKSAPVDVLPQPVLQLQLSVQVQLTGSQLLVGFLAVGEQRSQH